PYARNDAQLVEPSINILPSDCPDATTYNGFEQTHTPYAPGGRTRPCPLRRGEAIALSLFHGSDRAIIATLSTANLLRPGLLHCNVPTNDDGCGSGPGPSITFR